MNPWEQIELGLPLSRVHTLVSEAVSLEWIRQLIFQQDPKH